MIPGSRGRTQISPTPPAGSGVVLLVKDGHFRRSARTSGRRAFRFRISRGEHRHGKGLRHRVKRGDLDAETLRHHAVGFRRQRNDHGLPHAVLAFPRRRLRLQQNVGHRAEEVELGRAGRPDLVPEARGRESRRNRQGAVRPKRRIRRIPERVAVKERQAGEDDVVRPVAEIDRESPTDAEGLRMGTDHPFRGSGRSRRVHDVLRVGAQHRIAVRLVWRARGEACKIDDRRAQRVQRSAAIAQASANPQSMAAGERLRHAAGELGRDHDAA